MPPVEGGNVNDVIEHTIAISQGTYSVTELMDTINCIFLETTNTDLNIVELKYDCLSGRFHFVLRTEDADGNPLADITGVTWDNALIADPDGGSQPLKDLFADG